MLIFYQNRVRKKYKKINNKNRINNKTNNK